MAITQNDLEFKETNSLEFNKILISSSLSGRALLCVLVIWFNLILSAIFHTDIEEKKVRMKLTVIDTPGFGDQINNENW